MRIEASFDSLKNIIDNCSVIQSSNVNYDKRARASFVVNFILLMIQFLYFREFVDAETTVERLMYVYHSFKHRSIQIR